MFVHPWVKLLTPRTSDAHESWHTGLGSKCIHLCSIQHLDGGSDLPVSSFKSSNDTATDMSAAALTAAKNLSSRLRGRPSFWIWRHVVWRDGWIFKEEVVASSSALKMEKINWLETLPFYHSTLHHLPEDSDLFINCSGFSNVYPGTALEQQ